MRQSRNEDATQAPRRGRAAGVGEDALAHGGAAFARAGFADPGLVLRWADIAGPEVARVATPVKFQEDAAGGVLTLRCVPGAAVLLQHETRALIARINGYLGLRRVARLRLVTGAAARAPRLPGHPRSGLGQPESEEPDNLRAALDRLGQSRAQRGGRSD